MRIRHAVRGASLIDYGLLAGLIAVLAIGSIALLGDRITFGLRVADQELWMVMNEESNLLANGDFDDTKDMAVRSYGFSSGSLEGWRSENGLPFELHASGYQGMESVNGGYWLDMAASPGAMHISQDIPNLISGWIYTITLFAGDRSNDLGNETWVFWNGVKIGELRATEPDVMEEFRLHGEARTGINTLSLMEISEGPNDNDGMSIDVVRIWGR